MNKILFIRIRIVDKGVNLKDIAPLFVCAVLCQVLPFLCILAVSFDEELIQMEMSYSLRGNGNHPKFIYLTKCHIFGGFAFILVSFPAARGN